MKNIGDYVVYQRDVCKIVDKKTNPFTNKECYTLIPVRDESLKLNIPIDSPSIRDVIKKEDFEKYILEINDIPLISIEEKQMEAEYKRLLQSGTFKDLISIIKTSYLRNQKRIENNKKISDKDNKYFCLAEDYLYYEIAISYGFSYEEAKKLCCK